MLDEICLPGPALHWTDGQLLGNGNVGAVVWGTAERLNIGLSKHDINDLRSDLPHGTRWRVPYREIRDRVMAGARNVRELIVTEGGSPIGGQQQLSCGALHLEAMRAVQPIGFTQLLDLTKAEVRVEISPTIAGWTFGMQYSPVQVRTWVAATNNLIVVELRSEREQQIGWGYDRPPDRCRSAPVYGTSAAGDRLFGTMHIGMEGGGALAVGALGAGSFVVEAGRFGLRGLIGFGGEQGPAWLILALASEVESVDPVSAAVAAAADASAPRLAVLERGHREWWHDFWSKSTVTVGDAKLQRLWQMGLYQLGASTRPDTSPPNLQGIWVQDEVSPWHADFHFNTNVQECHWAACAANHPELQAALVRVLTHDWREQLRLTARESFDAPGLAVPLCTDWRGRAISAWGYWELCVTAWAAQHLWEQYLYTQDTTLLRDAIYPFLKECGDFYLALMVRDAQGQYNIEVSHSPEQMWFDETGQLQPLPGRNPTIDISCIRTLFEALVEGARVLGEDGEAVDAWQNVVDHLPPLPTLNGILIDYETGYFRDGDRPGFLPWCHRHPSRLMPIFPGRQIGLHSSEELLALGRRSFAEFRHRYGDKQFTGWSQAYQGCIAARLGLASEALACLYAVAEHHQMAGGLSSHNSLTPGHGNHAHLGGALFQIEALLGAAAAVNEMLVQRTADGVIHLFPAWPKELPAAFETLRVPGALLLSASYDGKQVTTVAVLAEAAGELALANPWGDKQAEVLGPDERRRMTGEVLRWTSPANTLWHIREIPTTKES